MKTLCLCVYKREDTRCVGPYKYTQLHIVYIPPLYSGYVKIRSGNTQHTSCSCSSSAQFFSLNHTRVYSTHRKVTVFFAIDDGNKQHTLSGARTHSHPSPGKNECTASKIDNDCRRHCRRQQSRQGPIGIGGNVFCVAYIRQSEFEYVVLYVLGINVISCTEAIKVESMDFKYSFCFIYGVVRSLPDAHTLTLTHFVCVRLCSSSQQYYWCRQEDRQRPDESQNKQQKIIIYIRSAYGGTWKRWLSLEYKIFTKIRIHTPFTLRRLHARTAAATAAVSSREREREKNTF